MIKSSGKGDRILGSFKGFSGNLEAPILDSTCLVLTGAAFFGGVNT